MKLNYLLLTIMPWVELRGAIPLAIGNGDLLAVPFIILINIFVFFPTYYILQITKNWIRKESWLDRRLNTVRDRSAPYVERYGLWGLAVFVMIPLPGTGVYAGTAAAWILGFRKRTAFLAIAIGLIMAGGLVLLLSLAVKGGLDRLF